MVIDLYSILTFLIVLTAIFSYINIRFIKLPSTIGIMIISLACSLLLLGLGKIYPELLSRPSEIIRSIDFETLLMNVMLSFLLFAGAIHVDFAKLKREMVPVISYATIGILISTGCVAGIMFFVFHLFKIQVPFIHCLLFGALISPTDPIAVLGILRDARIPASLETKISGESLFNDGVGVVIFLSLVQIAETGTENLSFMQISGLFLQEAGGGIVFGLVLGYLGYLLLKSIDYYQVEVLITLALVMGGYLFASFMHVSGPLAIVIAGIITGNKGRREAMSDVTKDYLNKFWELLDEILNALLFMLIGFEMIVLSFNTTTMIIGIIGIVVVLSVRFISLYLPTLILSIRRTLEPHLLPILTWGGLRGGISVALALSLPKSEYRDIILSTTYIIVVFSIIVQGLTIGKLVKKLTVQEKGEKSVRQNESENEAQKKGQRFS